MVLAGGVGDDGAGNGLAVEGDLLDTLLLAVRMDGNLVLGVAELALDGVVAGCLGQTGVDTDAVVVRLETEDELQHGVYEHTEYTPAQRKQAWRELEKVYKPHLDYEGEEFLESGGYWQFQHHIYSMPFYYIDYCLAQSCALAYKGWMDENREEAWKSYLKLCKLSASDFYTGLLKQVGLACPFEEGYMEKLVERLKNA